MQPLSYKGIAFILGIYNKCVYFKNSPTYLENAIGLIGQENFEFSSLKGYFKR